MKKSILLLAIISTFGMSSIFAQTKSTDTKQDKKDKVSSEMSGDAAQTAKEWTDKMDQVCTLTPDQEKKVMEINLRYANKLEDMKAKYSGSDNKNTEMAKQEKDQLTKERFKEYSNVLSDDQMRKFKEYRQSQKGEGSSDSGMSKDEHKQEMKDKYNNASPEEKEKMKEEAKDKKDKKDKKSSDS
ncbi:MAG: hypothetical protein R2794_12445 [Chitinophagales bacterium]